MNQDFSIVTLVLHASFVVQVVMAGLMLASLASWTVIFGKLFGLRASRPPTTSSSASSGPAATSTTSTPTPTKQAGGAPMERIFASGMREFFKLREKRVMDTGALLDGARRAMRASFQRELDAIESNLSFLASVGSVSPYVGLFGTVWGIMHAFIGLSNMTQVTLATVAPGIAEALVATAIGLFAAIPAVIAYNRFARDIDRIASQLESFIEEFSNILQRNAGAMPAPAAGRSRASRRRCPPSSTAAPRRRTISEINMVPFIDVMLVLLIIFMVTAPLITTGIVDLPSVGKARQRSEAHVVELVVGADEQLRMRIDGKDAAPLALADVAARVRDAQGGVEATPVVISADKSVRYESVVKVMDALQRAGIQRVGLSVKSQRSRP